ncbi:MAG: hypothetical protein WC450_07040, partial [Candidatus Omnitrophota bacterium]
MGKFAEMRFIKAGHIRWTKSSKRALPLVCCLLIFISGGCAKAYVPHYLQSRNPYVRRFHAGFETARRAVILALAEEGWIVQEETDPVVYERHPFNDLDAQQVLLISNDRETRSL